MYPNRRTFLRLAGLAGLGLLAGCTASGATPTPTDDPYVPTEPDYAGWFEGVSNYRGTVDRRGEPEVRVLVGTAGSTGFYKFDPPAVAVSQGTSVVWEWTGKGGTHNVVAAHGTFDSGKLVSKAGHTFAHTFDEPGVFTYVCEPHRSMGMKGAVFVALGAPGT